MPAHQIDEQLLAILACPSDDHAPLSLRPAAASGGAAAGDADAHDADGGDQVLVCTYCGSTFPIRDGIPVLLLDDAVPGPNGIGRPSQGRT